MNRAESEIPARFSVAKTSNWLRIRWRYKTINTTENRNCNNWSNPVATSGVASTMVLGIVVAWEVTSGITPAWVVPARKVAKTAIFSLFIIYSFIFWKMPDGFFWVISRQASWMRNSRGNRVGSNRPHQRFEGVRLFCQTGVQKICRTFEIIWTYQGNFSQFIFSDLRHLKNTKIQN